MNVPNHLKIASTMPFHWRAAAAAVAGRRHLDRGAPCQDAARTATAPRAYAIVCDGRGSSDVSQLGAQSAVRALPGILEGLEESLRAVLDDDDLKPIERDAPWRMAASFVCMFLQLEQQKLVREHGGAEHDYEFTLGVFITGRRFVGALQIGDCALVIRRHGVLGLVFTPVLGQYINETTFLGPGFDRTNNLQDALIPAERLDAVCAMTDGMAFHFVETHTARPAEAIGQVMDAVAFDGLGSRELAEVLDSPRWSERNTDDRALAVLVHGTALEPETQAVP